MSNKMTPERVFKEFDRSRSFNSQIDLYETVKKNERFFIGDQWNGVQSNGLPTPTYNFLKQVTLFNAASIISDNIKLQVSPLANTEDGLDTICKVVNGEFVRLFEYNRVGSLLREYVRNAAVDGDSCLYTYFDPDVETGQDAKGAIVTEVIENTRVHFGNPNDRRVHKQPYIIIESREITELLKDRARENGCSNTELIKSDTDNGGSDRGLLTDDKATVFLRLWRDKKSKTIHAYECTAEAEIRPEWDLGIKNYPITWLCWDYIKDSYHGQALISGLIPNQVFVNKTFAMVQLSLMSSAFPRTVFDATRIKKLDNRVGAAIPVNGGDVSNAIKTVEGAQVSPQISQFIDASISYTKSFLGATPAALGETRPDNTSAIIALQRAASIPSEITKQNLYQTVEDLGQIYIDFMGACYGKRMVKIDLPATDETLPSPSNSMVSFDFSVLTRVPMSLKLDVGASAYWSEIAAMTTLDNLLMQGHITFEEYLERIPGEYIPKRAELIEARKQPAALNNGGGAVPAGQVIASGTQPTPDSGGYNDLQQKVAEQGNIF